MDVFKEIRRAIELSGRHISAAKVVAVDLSPMAADVVLEGESVIREKVPLRIFNDEDNLGMAFIPKLGTEVLVAYIDGQEARPQIVKVQNWDQLILRKGPPDNPAFEIIIDAQDRVDLRKASGFQFTIDADDKVSIGNAPSHKLAWGDQWLIKFNQHTHPTPTGPSGPPMQPLIDTDVNSQIFTVE